MSKKLFFETIGWILIVALVISLAVIGIVLSIQGDIENYCISLGERLGYETELIGGYCYIKIRPGLKVREDQVVDFLPVIDCR